MCPSDFRRRITVVSDKPARILVQFTPAGYEAFFAQLGEPARSPTLPAPSVPNVQQTLAASRTFGVKTLGPLPAALEKAQQ